MAPSEEKFFADLGTDPRAQELLLLQAAEIAGLGYFVFNIDSERMDFCSESHAAIFGRTPDDFKRLATGLRGEMSMVHLEDRPILQEGYARLRDGESIRLDYRFYFPDGTLGYVREFVAPERDAAGSVVRGIGSSLDVTEMHREEEARHHRQRLAVIGELTAGVAHDFNNLLAIILGNAELLRGRGTGMDEQLGDIIAAAQKGGDLTRSLLSVAQRAPGRATCLDLVAETRQVAHSFSRSILQETDLQMETPPTAAPCMADRAQFHSAILNLLLNARHATTDGGKISVRVDVGRGYPGRFGTLADREICIVSVSDTGVGIPEHLKERVLEPFFTTRGRSEGSGLGLAMARGFARQFGGDLEIFSKEGVGTTVSLAIPTVPAG